MLAEKQETLEQRMYQRIVEWKEYLDTEDFKEEVLSLVKSWLEEPYFEEEVQYCKYNVSFYPEKTEKKLKDLNLETVGDVLKQLNGYTEDTHYYGGGTVCEMLKSDFEEIIMDWMYEFLKKSFSKKEFEEAHCKLNIIGDIVSELGCDELLLTEKFSELEL